MNILLVDDHVVLREGLRREIENLDHLNAVTETGDGREAVQLAREMHPDLIIMEISLPGLNGFDAARKILAEQPGLPIIAWSMHKNHKFVSRMLQTGARGYLVKESAFSEIPVAISQVIQGNVYLSPLVSDVPLDDF